MSLVKKTAETVARKAAGAALPAAKKYAAPALTTALGLAWKRLSWQARAAITAGSAALATYRRIARLRHRLQGWRLGNKKGQERKLSTAASLPTSTAPEVAAPATAGHRPISGLQPYQVGLNCWQQQVVRSMF